MLQGLYHYLHKVTGNVCTDFTMTNPLSSAISTKDGDKLVNSQAFKVFLNPQYADGEPGSCMESGYTWKQLKFDVYAKPAAKPTGMVAQMQPFL